MTDPTHRPRRGDRVTAILYHSGDQLEGVVTGTYVPRDDLPDTEPSTPDDAAWVDTGALDGPLMVKGASVERIEEEATVRADLRAIRDAAQGLADTVRTALARDLRGVPRVKFPLLPRLFSPVAVEPEPAQPDPRHVFVSVRTVPVVAEPSQRHVYHDGEGLTWQTYGQEHDFSEDRMLEIINGRGEIVATYAPGTWLEVRYETYVDATGQVAP